MRRPLSWSTFAATPNSIEPCAPPIFRQEGLRDRSFLSRTTLTRKFISLAPPENLWVDPGGPRRFQGIQGKKNVRQATLSKRPRLRSWQPGPSGHILPSLTWLSLVELLASRAQLRFARQPRLLHNIRMSSILHILFALPFLRKRDLGSAANLSVKKRAPK